MIDNTQQIRDAVELLHKGKGVKVCLMCTGAGAGLQNLLAQTAGASNTVLEGIFPYSTDALADWINFTPEKYVDDDVALRMAARAYIRAMELDINGGGDGDKVVGLGLTAVIASTEPKKGDYRVYLAVRSKIGFAHTSILFPKQPGSNFSLLGRIKEGEICDLAGLNLILYAAGIETLPLDFGNGPEGQMIRTPAPKFIHRSQYDFAIIDADGRMRNISNLDPEKTILFDGSFSIFHHSHFELAEVVARIFDKEVIYTMTTSHPTKGEVPSEELFRRVRQFQWVGPVLLTRNLGFYIDKARVFPGFSFMIGSDVLDSILNPEFYSVPIGSILDEFMSLGVTFYVASRPDGQGNLITPRDILKARKVSDEHGHLFVPVCVRGNASSTLIRERLKAAVGK